MQTLFNLAPKVEYIFGMPDKNKKSVLIVDDNRDAADTLAILIRMAGCEASVAYDTETGITLAHASPPDIIFHDIGMPIINGYEAARIFRGSEKFADTILIAVTAYDATEDHRRAKSAGFDSHMSKPIEFEDLKEVLSRPKPPTQ